MSGIKFKVASANKFCKQMLKLGNVIDKKVEKILEKESCCTPCTKESADYVVSGDVYTDKDQYPADTWKVENLLTWNIPEVFPNGGNYANYWVAPNDFPGEFILRFDKPRTVDTITMVNTRNRGTNEFKVYLADSEDGPWTEVLHDYLEDPRNTNPIEASVPPKVFYLSNPTCGQYVKFQIISWYGWGGGLQYFSTCPLKCEKEHYPFLNKCYQFVQPENDISWNEANAECNKRGGQLASIPNAETNDFISSVLAPNAETYFGLIKDGPADNEWTWTDGTPFDYENWGTYVPQPSGDGFCGDIWNQYGAGWNDLPCSTRYEKSFLCQKNPTY